MRIILKDEKLSEEINLSKKGHLCWFDKEDSSRFQTLKVTVLVKDKYSKKPETALLKLILDQNSSFLNLVFRIGSLKVFKVSEGFDYSNIDISFDGKNWIKYATHPDEL